jgi:hypothetical protein
LDPRDHKVFKEYRAMLGNKALEDLMVMLDHKAFKASRAYRVIQAPPDHKAFKATLVHKVSRAYRVSKVTAVIKESVLL